MSYCSYIKTLSEPRRTLHRTYHDFHYGYPLHDDNELFGRLLMEINQAGLSWETILKKEAGFREAYDHFDVTQVARYGKADIDRLLADDRIIRNRLKIQAAIHNAKVIMQLQANHGSFEKWLEKNHPRSLKEWTKLFKATFKFTGGEIVNEFLMSTGYLAGAHEPSCPTYKKILRTRPAWAKK